ncbi:MAG: flagellar basal body rod protein FlgC [Oscillibacter sp.]|nr:flagellar basal body rod protein FlgC [Oscillibacter sp.]
MAFLTTMNIIGSGLTAQQLRLDVISENITNINTTRTAEGGPYRRKVIRLQAETGKDGFRMALAQAARKGLSVRNQGVKAAGGVRVTEILEDEGENPIVYDPTLPDANEEGYVEMPNVTLVKEVTDAMAASQAYSADVTAFNILKQIVSRGLDIGT